MVKGDLAKQVKRKLAYKEGRAMQIYRGKTPVQKKITRAVRKKRIEPQARKIMNAYAKASNLDIIWKKLMKRKSFRESTPMSRELKFKRAIARRKKR
jgi:hypothetical protein